MCPTSRLTTPAYLGALVPRTVWQDYLHLLVKLVAAANSRDGENSLEIFGKKFSFGLLRDYCRRKGRGWMASFNVVQSDFDAHSKMNVPPRDHITGLKLLTHVIDDSSASNDLRLFCRIFKVLRLGINAFTEVEMPLMTRLYYASASASVIKTLRVLRAGDGLGATANFFSANAQECVVANQENLFVALAARLQIRPDEPLYPDEDQSQSCETYFRRQRSIVGDGQTVTGNSMVTGERALATAMLAKGSLVPGAVPTKAAKDINASSTGYVAKREYSTLPAGTTLDTLMSAEEQGSVWGFHFVLVEGASELGFDPAGWILKAPKILAKRGGQGFCDTGNHAAPKNFGHMTCATCGNKACNTCSGAVFTPKQASSQHCTYFSVCGARTTAHCLHARFVGHARVRAPAHIRVFYIKGEVCRGVLGVRCLSGEGDCQKGFVR